MRTAQAGFKVGKGGKTPADLLAEVGPTLRVDLGLKSRSHPPEPPDLQAKGLHALIDTGAGANAIDDALTQHLGLPPTEEGESSGVHGKAMTTFYLARLYVPALDLRLFERFAGAKLEEGDQTHRVILGRSFLRRYRMVYDAISGQVELIEP
jgi:hypothetical protein